MGLIQRKHELEIDRLFRPERAVIVEHCHPVGDGHEIGRGGVDRLGHEGHNGGFGRSVVPGRQRRGLRPEICAQRSAPRDLRPERRGNKQKDRTDKSEHGRILFAQTARTDVAHVVAHVVAHGLGRNDSRQIGRPAIPTGQMTGQMTGHRCRSGSAVWQNRAGLSVTSRCLDLTLPGADAWAQNTKASQPIKVARLLRGIGARKRTRTSTSCNTGT